MSTPTDRLDSLLESQQNVRANIVSLKNEHPELGCGYSVSNGGILNAYRECDITFNDATQKLREVAKKQNNKAGYEMYLFSKLWHFAYPEHKDLEYDYAFEKIAKSYDAYIGSPFNDANISGYECIQSYLKDEVAGTK